MQPVPLHNPNAPTVVVVSAATCTCVVPSTVPSGSAVTEEPDGADTVTVTVEGASNRFMS